MKEFKKKIHGIVSGPKVAMRRINEAEHPQELAAKFKLHPNQNISLGARVFKK